MTVPTVVLGATGYVAGELLRLIAGHPEFELAAAVSRSRAGEPIDAVFPHLRLALDGHRFTAPEALPEVLGGGAKTALFSAAPHGASADLVNGVLQQARLADTELRIVDVSADFRFRNAGLYANVYGQEHPQPGLLDEFVCAVPEHYGGSAPQHAAHPGCFATSALLATVPLTQSGMTRNEYFVAGITGSTGSGKSPLATTHHPERHSNLYAYKPLTHRHQPEIETLTAASAGRDVRVNFVPHSGPFARGIHTTIQGALASPLPPEKLADTIAAYYADSRFVSVTDKPPRLKDVVGGNECRMSVTTAGDTFSVCVVIDNLVKGAAGGAVQWMNRLFDLPEETGLTWTGCGWT